MNEEVTTVSGLNDLMVSMFSRAEDAGADLMLMSHDFYIYFAAHQHFGKRVNRANRHKFRRSLLYVMQMTSRKAEVDE